MTAEHTPAEIVPEFAEMVIDPTSRPSLAELGEFPADDALPPLDRAAAPPAMSADQAFWRANGYLILKRFMPEPLIDRYCAVKERIPDHLGFPSPVPYLQIAELRDLCLYKPLADKLRELISRPMGLILNLTQWRSTERNWHQDDYLNPDFITCWYAAVWIALDDIHPDSGPFEFVPGSHRWPLMRGEPVRARLKEPYRSSGQWPKYAEYFTNGAYQDEIARTGARVEPFLARKGDVLVWHSRLVHRGSEPRVPGMRRKTCIAHYTALDRSREDVAYTAEGVPYFLVRGHDFDWEQFVRSVAPAAAAG